jgi:hypothetical protein
MTETRWYPEGRGPVTPWGNADSRETLAEGVDFYSTPSHGGFYVSRGNEAVLDTALRRHGITAGEARMGYAAGWYEEDCSYLAVVVAFPYLFPEHDPEEALASLRYWLAPREERVHA